MNLHELKTGEKGIIQKVRGKGAFRRRIVEMGFVRGQVVEVIKKAPLKDPIEYSIMGYYVSLRSSEAQLIEIIPLGDLQQESENQFEGVVIGDGVKTSRQNGRTINVALVGNPNSGKTTFFNHATGSKERVANYSGVTVDAKQATFKQKGYKFNITDLPGTYSISAYSPEEIYVRDFITETLPDVVINVVDASNLERNLYLTTQLIDMDIKVVMVLNMYDEFEKRGDRFDYIALGQMIGIPIIPVVSSRGKGVRDVFNKVIEVFEDLDHTQRHIHISYGEVVEKSIKNIQNNINVPENQHLVDSISTRYLAIKLLERDQHAKEKIVSKCFNHHAILSASENEALRVEQTYKENTETVIADLKYGFISGALRETLQPNESEIRQHSRLIDALLTHQVFGFPFFLLFMWLMFSATFTLGSYPMGWIESGVAQLSLLLENIMTPGPLKDLLINGVIGGAGGVLVFLPNIVLLFFFISLMEDTGYMSRAAFIMDKLMHKIGLHGKSFIPLLMGFGCNVPAIMATRTIVSRNDRLITMLINPFMSCSARLPVFVLFISAFFPNNQGTILFLIYLTGIMVAVGMAIVFKKTLFKSQEVPFVMELPPYRVPTLKVTTRHMWGKAVHYLKKISGIILIASIVIWALGYFPKGYEYSQLLEQQSQVIIEQHEAKIISNPLITDSERAILEEQKEMQLLALDVSINQKIQEQSLIGNIGKFIEPVLQPLGFDWKMSISIVTGFAAKEIVVSTLAVLYQADENMQTDTPMLVERLQNYVHDDGPRKGQNAFTPLIALSFMLFVLLYFPCIAVLSAIIKESGHWKWGIFSVAYTTAIAWIVSFIVFQVGSLLGF